MPPPLEAVENAAAPKPPPAPKAAARPRAGATPGAAASALWKRPEAVELNAPSSELQDLKDRYLSWLIATRYAEATVKAAHTNVEWLYKFLGGAGIARIADVTPEVLNDYSLWLRELRRGSQEGPALGNRHLHFRLDGAKQFFKYLSRNMIVLYDPAEDLELPNLHIKLPQVLLTQAEVRKFLDAPDLRGPVGYRDKAMLELIYATGLRAGEVYRLKVGDLDFKAKTVMVRRGKGAKDGIVPLPALTAGYLKEYVEKVRPKFAKGMKGGDDGTLFISFHGGKFDRGKMCGTFKRVGKLAGLEKRVTAMTLRHAIASHLLENGLGIRFIQEFLRHEKLETTQLYAKVSLLDLRKKYNKHHPKEKRVNGKIHYSDD